MSPNEAAALLHARKHPAYAHVCNSRGCMRPPPRGEALCPSCEALVPKAVQIVIEFERRKRPRRHSRRCAPITRAFYAIGLALTWPLRRPA